MIGKDLLGGLGLCGLLVGGALVLPACMGHEMCDVPSLRPKYGTLIKDSDLYGKTAANAASAGTPYMACEARPVPSYVSVMMSTRQGINQERIDVQAAGLAHGMTADDCGPAAISACEEAVNAYFDRMRISRPGSIRCTVLESKSCTF